MLVPRIIQRQRSRPRNRAAGHPARASAAFSRSGGEISFHHVAGVSTAAISSARRKYMSRLSHSGDVLHDFAFSLSLAVSSRALSFHRSRVSPVALIFLCFRAFSCLWSDLLRRSPARLWAYFAETCRPPRSPFARRLIALEPSVHVPVPRVP